MNLFNWLRRPRPSLPGPDLTLTAAYRAQDIVHALAGMHPLGGTSADREGDGR